jgi:SAM-dependent methyltransferase
VPIGDFTRCLYNNPVAKLLCNLFGAEDIHTHYRVRSVLDFFARSFTTNGELKVLEVGCGGGTNLFELAKQFPVRADGYDLDPEHIRIAREINDKEFGSRIRFHVADACTLALASEYDALLFVDFLEHVPNPQQIIATLSPCVKPGGIVCVSVPTPRYPQVFGREMHERIGHLVDGYTPETLDRLFPATYSRIETRYSTGPIGSVLCAIQARLIMQIAIPQLRWVCSTPLLAMHNLDFFNGPSISATLFAVYRKSAATVQ